MQSFQRQFWPKFREFAKVFFYLLAVSFILLWPAIWNGYPLFFSDSSKYILSSITRQVPNDRPIGYSYFIRLFFGGFTLWTVIFAQAFFTVYLLWKAVGIFFKKHRYKIHLLTVACLGFFTLAPWMASQMMPDIFSGLLLLIIFVFTTGEMKLAERCFLVFLMFLFLITHNANFLLSFGVLALTWVCLYFKKSFAGLRKKYFKRIGVLAIVTIFAPIFFVFSNYHQGYGLTLNPSSHVFMMSRVNEAGILDDFLLTHCSEVHYFLCDYQGHFPQDDGFIWDTQSPANIEGWDNAKPEYDDILHQIFTNPRYIFTFIADSAYRSSKLFFMWGMDNYYPYDSDPQYPKILQFSPSEFSDYSQTRQYQGQFQSVDFFALTYFLVVFLSAVAVAWMFFRGLFDSQEKFFIFEVLALFAINSVVLGTLSGVYGRYQERIVWLLPLSLFLFAAGKIFNKKISAKK